jgi:hypothetical protein
MSKEQEMVELLSARTENGTLGWETTAQENEFVTSSSGGASIFIKQLFSSNDPDPDFEFSVRDKDDRYVFSIFNNGNGVDYKGLSNLHELARRSALKIDKTIDSILNDLRRT